MQICELFNLISCQTISAFASGFDLVARGSTELGKEVRRREAKVSDVGGKDASTFANYYIRQLPI